jgi:universal stress protein F
MYKNVLVAIALDHSPESNKALEVARLLTGGDGTITALHVVEDIPMHVASRIPDDILSKSLGGWPT